MNPEQLVDAINAQPFQPFLIRMTNDRVYHVDRPELVLLAPSWWAVSVVNESSVFSILALANIASIEFRDPAMLENI